MKKPLVIGRRESMPTPVMSQPIRIAPAPALAAMFWGRLKMPLPITSSIQRFER